jgi:hypothetical protein
VTESNSLLDASAVWAGPGRSVLMAPTPEVEGLGAAARERLEAVERLALIDASLRAHRRSRHWRTVRRLLIARGGVYRHLIELNEHVERLGGDPLPRRRFQRGA